MKFDHLPSVCMMPPLLEDYILHRVLLILSTVRHFHDPVDSDPADRTTVSPICRILSAGPENGLIGEARPLSITQLALRNHGIPHLWTRTSAGTMRRFIHHLAVAGTKVVLRDKPFFERTVSSNWRCYG